MHQEGLETAGTILLRAGLKRTMGRIAIINLLMTAEYPLSQHEIAHRLPKVSMNGVSIYRSLDAFLKAGIVHRVESGDRTWRFAICGCGTRGHCHPHFICKQCGKVECLPGHNLPEFGKMQPGYVVEEQEFYIRGRCAGCST